MVLGRADLGPTSFIDEPVASRGGEPRARGPGDAVAWPALKRSGEGILGALLGEVPVTTQPDERCDDASPFGPVGARDRGLDIGDYSSQIGLTSIVPWLAAGILEATSIASSRSPQSTR